MNQVRTICIRFNLDRPEHKKAWDRLHHMDRKKEGSCSRAVIHALNAYFDREDDEITVSRSELKKILVEIQKTSSVAESSQIPCSVSQEPVSPAGIDEATLDAIQDFF